MKRPVRILLTVVAVIAVIVCVFCILFIVQYVRGKSVSDKLGSDVRSGQVVEPLAPQDDGKYMAINVDFDSLHDVNPEIYAWIEVPGTNINYAVVQSAADDLFYDDHGVDRSYYSGGSIFSQRYNTTTFQDPVTVLYGHNRQSQTMFAQVNNFADAEFFAKNQKIIVYTPDKVYEYTIFAAYPHSSEHLLLCHDFTDPQQFADYFASLGEAINANYRRDLFPQAGDRVLTLSTCYRQNRMQRFLVQGVLTETYDVINEEKPMEQEKQEAPVQGKKKRLSTPLLIFIILMAVTLTLCAVVAGIWLHGRSSLRNQGAAPTDTPDDTQQLDSYTVLHDGKYYRYKDHMVNLLLIGVDSDNKPAAPLPYGSDNQADVILVAALDTDANRMTLISVSRDTMCDIAVLDQNGQVSGAAHTQLALSYSNGDGLYESCRLCQEAVSQLFYGLQFDGCAAFYMGGIGRLNDAVGGVTVSVLDDYPFTDVPNGWNMYPGQDVTLTGRQARLYIQARRGDATGNEDRMKRQKQYMLALISQAKDRVAASPASVVPLYNAVSDYVLTDLDLGKLSYLATQAAGMSFSGDMLRVTGDAVLGQGNRVELTVDQQALYDLILDVFYEEIPAPTDTAGE